MSIVDKNNFPLPPEQQAIRDKCFHPSGTFVEFPIEDVETSIPARFEKIARLHSRRVAVKVGPQALTYEALNRAANLLAWTIYDQRGACSEPLLLMVQHGANAVASLLGVLKAGRILVVADPASSIDQLREIMESTQAAVLVTDRHNLRLANALATHHQQVIDIDAPLQANDTNLELQLSPDSIAQIVFSSGSTGSAKGIVFSHRNVLHRTMVPVNATRICPEDRIAEFRKPAFGAGIIGLFRALLTGAGFFSYDVKEQGLAGVVTFLNRESISLLNPGAAIFRNWASEVSGNEMFPSVRLVNVGGAPVYRRDVEAYKRIFSSRAILMHTLACSEAGYLSMYFVDRDSECATAVLPAGYPADDQEIFLVDEKGIPTEPGAVGEIAVRSRYLSVGYWRDDQLTRSRFLAASGGGEKRTFLTGDLGRMLPDGCLFHLERKDFQRKIRGYRVSLVEIESTLSDHPAVKESVATTWENDAGETFLAAYIVPQGERAPSLSDLRRYLKARLPDYKIPSAFVFLDNFPQVNGKVDRHSLPRPERGRPDLDRPYTAAATATESQLVEIWQEILNVRPIGIDDEFFELSGDSLSATRVVSQVFKRFQLEIPLRSLFDAPTIAAMAKLIAEHESEQIDNPQLDRSLTETSNRSRPIACHGETAGRLPLSYAEEGLWLMAQLQPGMSAWNMQSRWRLRGALDVVLLERSLNALIERHETLRTSYHLVDGSPVRVVAADLEIKVSINQVEPSLDPDRAIELIGLEDRSRPFDLTIAPLLRVRIVRLNEQDHVLIITQHHIVTDAWSSRIFSRELFALYGAASRGQPLALAALPIQYSDYARWDRQSDQEETAATVAYWQEKLTGYTVQEIPTDKRRPFRRTYNGATEEIHLAADLTQTLGTLCKEERVTRFMLLVAAFKILLGRYTRSSDIIVGSALAGRHRPELENLLGMFINILPLRTDLSGEPTFREVLRRVRETCLEAYRHQDMPFDRLMQLFNPNREVSRTPFFQVLFDVANLPRVKHEGSGLEIETLMRSDRTARYEVVIRAPQSNEGMAIQVDYNVDLFSQSRIAAILDEYKSLLEQIAANPDGCIGDFSLVTTAARQTLPDPEAPLDDTWRGAVHELMVAQAQRQPEKIAVKDSQEAWTYRELDRRTNQLARCLLAQGIGRDAVVVIYGPISAGLVWALMGTLKAGAAFFIVDPAQPAARLKACLDTLQPKALIQCGAAPEPQLSLDEILPLSVLTFRVTLPPLAIVQAQGFLAEHLPDNPAIPVGADDLAYVIFTSGTTGTPKGVEGRHGPLTHFLPWVQETFQITANDRFSVLAGHSSNILQREIFTTLSIGGSLHIPNPAEVGSFGKLDGWMKDEAISVVHLTPAMARLMFESANQSVPSVQRIFFAGDLLRWDEVDEVRQLMPNAKVINFYNSSESQRAGGYSVIPHVRDESDKEIVPLGRGIRDVQLLVLNQKGDLAGINEMGEICVRSPHLALGYRSDEPLTKARFITNPFTQVQGDRIYRTGEFGRFLPTGEVEFVARAESRVSIRGYRVELGEIEAALKSHPGIADAVVTLDQQSKETLIAHVVRGENSAPTAAQLKSHLRAQLPRHMIPAAIVFLDSLPLTPTGKVDRAALAHADFDDIDRDSDFVAPRTDLEKKLADIWSELLKREKIGVHDNFFDLGGHSLSATRLVSMVLKQFHLEIPLRALFDAPTIAQMAGLIAEHAGSLTPDAELERLLRDIETLSEEEVQKQLARESARRIRGAIDE